LQSMTAQRDVILAGQSCRLGHRRALGDSDLGANDVDPGHLLGNRVFDLDPRIDLDEIELVCVHIHQEFDGAGTTIIRMPGDLETHFTDLGPFGVAEIGRRRTLDDLLVAPLHRTVAFVQMQDLPVMITENLDFDMARPLDHLFQITLAVAEGGFRLATAFKHLVFQLIQRQDRPHSAAAAAPACLEHERIADLLGHAADFVHVVGQDFGCRNDGHSGFDRGPSRRCLVAKHPHGRGRRADEGDAGSFASIDEIRVFRQQAIAGVNCVRTRQPCDANDLVDAQIGGNGAHSFANLIGLVRLVAVQAEFVLLGIDRDGLLAEFVCRTHDADCDLAAIGDQDLVNSAHRSILLFQETGLTMINAPARDLFRARSQFRAIRTLGLADHNAVCWLRKKMSMGRSR